MDAAIEDWTTMAARGRPVDTGASFCHDCRVDLHARFSPFFPIGDGLVRLAVIEADEELAEESEAAIVVVRLFVFDQHEGGLVIRDIKEQQLYCGPAALYRDTTRVDEMLYAQQEVLGELLRGPVEEFETMMPHDLVFTDVMTLVRARTREDFARALRVKSRLGRYLARQRA
jgi:hypothetical protein